MKQVFLILAVVALFGLGYYLLTSTDDVADNSEQIIYTSEVFTFSTENEQMSVQYSEDSEHAQVSLSGVQYDLKRSPAASGARYENEDGSVVFWEQGGEAMLEVDGEMVVEEATSVSETGETILTFTVDAEKVDCVGVGPQECLVVNGEYFYDAIEGFEFEAGNEYVLLVERTDRENVPADASAYEYRLVEEVSKTPVVSESAPALEDTVWTWEETLYSDDEVVTPDQADAFVLTFTEAGRFSATTDCNTVMGSYVSPDEAGINFSQMASTKKACLDGSQEAEFTGMLDSVTDYVLTEDANLALTLEMDSGTMLFVPAEE